MIFCCDCGMTVMGREAGFRRRESVALNISADSRSSWAEHADDGTGGVGCRAVGGEREGQEAVQTSVGLTSTAVGAFVLPPDRVPAGGAPDENWRAGREGGGGRGVAEGWQRGGRGVSDRGAGSSCL